MPDRASRRLFTGAILKPSGKTFTGDVSQKILSATACRYFIFWMCNLLSGMNEVDGPALWLDNDLGISFYIAIFPIFLKNQKSVRTAMNKTKLKCLHSKQPEVRFFANKWFEVATGPYWRISCYGKSDVDF